MLIRSTLLGSCLLLMGTVSAAEPVHNVILFVPDGLRAVMVTPARAPAMAAVRDQGVNFENSHSLFPTFTTANASAFATGHYLGDTGNFSNTLYMGFPVPAVGGSVTAFLENNAVLGDVDEHFAGNYLDEVSVLAAARGVGYNTASIGKLGPALIQDHTARSGERTVIIDDATGSKSGIPLAPWVVEAFANVGLSTTAAPRGANGSTGNSTTPGTTVANIDQQNYFTDALTKVVLPKFQKDAKPFIVVFWSRDPDGTQHYNGDSLNMLRPGINGPSSLAAIKNADDDLARIRDTLVDLHLDGTTDIFISADHGFATISKESHTSGAARRSYEDTPAHFLPQGFLAIDLSDALGLPLWDPEQGNKRLEPGMRPRFANGLIGEDPAQPTVVVAGNGGSDLIYLPRPVPKNLTARIVKLLLAQDYVSGLFVDPALGTFPGTLSLSDINLKGYARTPIPAIVVNFRSFSTGCAEPLECAAVVADSTLNQGQGMHGSFSRAETKNFMAAIGPDFKSGFADPAPVSNADIAITMAQILKLDLLSHGPLEGRVLAEAMPNGTVPRHQAMTLRSTKAANGLQTVLQYQTVGQTQYFDAAGFPGRTLGLRDAATPPGR